jgi:DNA-binding CsgD family transcriptional regulator
LASALENLSDREMHIFQLLGSGLGTREIAQSLDLSVKTVESHRENIKHKLRLSSGAQLRDRAAKWVAAASGVGESGKLPARIFPERKQPDPAADSERSVSAVQSSRPFL